MTLVIFLLFLSDLPCRLWALLSSYGFLFTVKYLFLSSAVVNCVQCHPFDCFVATSGIDNTIKVSIIRVQLYAIFKINFLILVGAWCSYGLQLLLFRQWLLVGQQGQKLLMC